jgi:hypothetical protein
MDYGVGKDRFAEVEEIAGFSDHLITTYVFSKQVQTYVKSNPINFFVMNLISMNAMLNFYCFPPSMLAHLQAEVERTLLVSLMMASSVHTTWQPGVSFGCSFFCS